MQDLEKILNMSLDDIMSDRFGRYSKYIIQDRALPDVRDGLKPVQRRILYAMYQENNVPSKPYRKSAKTVGNVIGNYHPHGDSSVYEAMVRLSQDWKMRIPLIDMQGNNGSIDNDPAAAMRYTEARLSKISLELLKDIDKETVLMALNFDDTEYEPTVLPAKFPNLLVNGATGISAGYATDIPPHNLNEVIDATIYRIKHPECAFEKLTQYIQGPDFPTGAIVEGKKEVYKALKTGKGKVVVRAKCEIIEQKNMNQIIVHEIPYEVNKSELVRKIDEIRVNKDIDGIIEVRDESDRNGLQIVIDLKKDVDATNSLNYFYKNTDLQKNYNYNMVAIKDKRPLLMGIEAIIDGYIDHAIEVITKRTIYDLNKAKTRLHIVLGLIKAIEHLDEVVKVIRQSKDKQDAKNNIIQVFGFTSEQAEAIVMLQLYRLTNTDIHLLEDEKAHLQSQIENYESILDSDEVLRNVIIDELKMIKKTYPEARRTQIKEEVAEINIDAKATIIAENCFVSVSKDGYIKRISERSYKASEGTPFGKKEGDYLVSITPASSLDNLLIFTNQGNYAFIPLYKLEYAKWKDLGKHISYLTKMSNDEKVIQTLLVTDFNIEEYVVIATKQGNVKRVLLKDFEVTRYTKMYKYMSLKDYDEVINVDFSYGNEGVVLGSKAGYGYCLDENEISIMGLKASGVKGMNLSEDELAFMHTFDMSEDLSLVMYAKPSGVKRVHLSDLPVNRRGAKGNLIFKKPASKNIKLIDGYVLKPNDTLTIYFDNEEVSIYAKDYPYHPLDKNVSMIKGYESDITHIYNPNYAYTKEKDTDSNFENYKEKKEEFKELSLMDLINQKGGE